MGWNAVKLFFTEVLGWNNSRSMLVQIEITRDILDQSALHFVHLPLLLAEIGD